MGRHPINRFVKLLSLRITPRNEKRKSKRNNKKHAVVDEEEDGPTFATQAIPVQQYSWDSTSSIEEYEDDDELLTASSERTDSERSTASASDDLMHSYHSGVSLSSDKTCNNNSKDNNNNKPSRRRSVTFGECEVRTYSQILGDHPYCSGGCPVELSWDFQASDAVKIDEFESSRAMTRRHSMQDLRLTSEERHSILQNQSYSLQELRKACRKQQQHCSVGGSTSTRFQRRQQRRVQKEFFCN